MTAGFFAKPTMVSRICRGLDYFIIPATVVRKSPGFTAKSWKCRMFILHRIFCCHGSITKWRYYECNMAHQPITRHDHINARIKDVSSKKAQWMKKKANLSYWPMQFVPAPAKVPAISVPQFHSMKNQIKTLHNFITIIKKKTTEIQWIEAF